MAASEEVCMIDAEDNVEYKIILNKKDAERARRDINFATLLLRKAKENVFDSSICNATVNNSEPSTSITITNTNESTESTHIWTRPETLLLLDLYSEHQDEYQNGKGTVKQYWDKIAKEMQEKEYDVTGVKCSTKFQALKRTYKTVLDHNNKSGNNRKEWEYLKTMNELFRDKPWVKPITVAGSHMEEEEQENTPQEKCIKKRKLNTYIQDYIACNKEEQKRKRELREKQHEEKLTAFKRLENLLQKVLEKEDTD